MPDTAEHVHQWSAWQVGGYRQGRWVRFCECGGMQVSHAEEAPSA